MSVLHFGFDDENEDNPHRPQNLCKSNVVYTGTHDNDTTMGWWGDADEARKKRVEEVGLAGENPCETLIRVAMSSPAPLAVIPLQDILELGTDARMNTPGKPDGNWRWKFDWPQLAQGKWSIMQRSEF
jgi:4-alpha-glucanotransferase